MPTQIVYYDEIRRGNSIEEVDFNINPSLKAIDWLISFKTKIFLNFKVWCFCDYK